MLTFDSKVDRDRPNRGPSQLFFTLMKEWKAGPEDEVLTVQTLVPAASKPQLYLMGVKRVTGIRIRPPVRGTGRQADVMENSRFLLDFV